jgi:hypothetical protein
LLDSDEAYVELTKTSVTSALGYTPVSTNTTYEPMVGASSTGNGAKGLVPAPLKGE